MQNEGAIVYGRLLSAISQINISGKNIRVGLNDPSTIFICSSFIVALSPFYNLYTHTHTISGWMQLYYILFMTFTHHDNESNIKLTMVLWCFVYSFIDGIYWPFVKLEISKEKNLIISI